MANLKSEVFANICAGLQAVVVSAGVIIGGYWAYYKFESLEEEKKAESVLKREQLEFELLYAKLKGNTSLDISLEVENIISQTEQDKTKFGLIITVSAQNNGSRDAILRLKEDSLTVSKIKTDDSSVFSPIIYNAKLLHFKKSENGTDSILTTEKYLQAGSLKRMSFYLEVTSPGLYQAHFKAPADAIVKKEYKELEKKLFPSQENSEKEEELNMIWSAEKFILIK